MRYEITEENNIILSGLQLLRRQFDSLSEYVVFSVIQTMTQARRGQYDGNINFIAQWSMLSDVQARRIIHNLVKKGYVEAEYRAGDTTILRAVPLSKCEPYQNDSPITGDKTPLSFGTPFPPTPPIPIESSKNLTTTSKSAHTHEGIEKLKKWINTADLDFWMQKQFDRYKITEEIETLIQTFYEDDFTVREDIESNQRREVLKHFQAWLPKYLKSKQQEQDGNDRCITTKSPTDRAVENLRRELERRGEGLYH